MKSASVVKSNFFKLCEQVCDSWLVRNAIIWYINSESNISKTNLGLTCNPHDSHCNSISNVGVGEADIVELGHCCVSYFYGHISYSFEVLCYQLCISHYIIGCLNGMKVSASEKIAIILGRYCSRKQCQYAVNVQSFALRLLPIVIAMLLTLVSPMATNRKANAINKVVTIRKTILTRNGLFYFCKRSKNQAS